MNILFLTRLYCPHIGGVERHVMKVSDGLIKKGHKVIIIAEQHSSGLKLHENISGLEIFRIPNLVQGKFKKFQIWRWLWDNRKLIKDSDVVHCHDVFFWYLPFRFLFPLKKIFTTFHGYEGYPLRQKNILTHKISEKLSMGNICIGDFIEKWYGTKPNFVSYGGVEIQNSKLQISNKIKKESALFIGRLDQQTGIKTYVDAVKQIRKKIPNFQLKIIGDGKYRNEIEKDFAVVGFLKNSEKYLTKYNFAFVSRYLSILEAMAARKLVFAVYDNPLKEDYLRMAPFSKYIIIVSSVSELASKVIFYFNNLKIKEEMIESAYAWVRRLSWGEMINTYLKLWKIQK